MQKIVHASLSFKLQKTAKKPIFGAHVINALSILVAKDKEEQLNYLNLPVPVKELRIINDDLSTALKAALTGNNNVVKNAVIQWDAAFTLTANYISSLANGDENFIRNTGFVPAKNDINSAQKIIGTSKFKTVVDIYAYSAS